MRTGCLIISNKFVVSQHNRTHTTYETHAYVRFEATVRMHHGFDTDNEINLARARRINRVTVRETTKCLFAVTLSHISGVKCMYMNKAHNEKYKPRDRRLMLHPDYKYHHRIPSPIPSSEILFRMCVGIRVSTRNKKLNNSISVRLTADDMMDV